MVKRGHYGVLQSAQWGPVNMPKDGTRTRRGSAARAVFAHAMWISVLSIMTTWEAYQQGVSSPVYT